ncbi:kelch repeat-containing protein [Calditrichota bacterium LG25]
MKRIQYLTIIFMLQVIFPLIVWGGEWKSFIPVNTPRAGAASVVLDGKIYVLGGKSLDNRVLNTVECYDPAQNAWIEDALPPFEEERYNASAVVFKGKIYLIGGRGSSEVLDYVEVFDPVQNEWQDVQDIHDEREGHVAVIIKNHIYIIGGQENEYEITKKIEWYDEANDEWIEEREKCPFPRVAHFGASLNDIFYMFGGYYFGMNENSYRWKASPPHSGWENLPALSQARAYGATVVKGDSIFLIGGETASGKTDLVEIFDVRTQSLSTGPSLPAPRSGLTGVCLNDTIFVIGGYDPATGKPISTVDIFVETATAIDEPAPGFRLPRSEILINGYPNPFNGQISIDVTLPRLASYRIDIYNLKGQHIKSLFNGMATGGSKHFIWQAQNEKGQLVSSGIYWLVVRSPYNQAVFKIIYAR